MHVPLINLQIYALIPEMYQCYQQKQQYVVIFHKSIDYKFYFNKTHSN